MQGMLRFIAMVAALLSGIDLVMAQEISMEKFSLKYYRFEVVYHRGGLLATQVMPNKRDKIVKLFTGGYFDTKSFTNVDFTKVGPYIGCCYLERKHRPVLAFGKNGGVRIIRPRPKTGTIELRQSDWYALAGDYMAIYPTRSLVRHMVAISKGFLVSILYRGTYARCKSYMKGKGYTNYMYLDGGDTPLQIGRVPSWVVVYNKA